MRRAVHTGGSERSETDRAVSTVLDVGIALLLVAAAMGVLVTLADQSDDSEHDPTDAEYTTQVVTTATVPTTYHVETAIEEAVPDHEYDRADLRRIAHGTIAAHTSAVAVTNVEFDGKPLTTAAVEYEAQVDETLQATLVESSFETNVTAVWEPFDGAPINGTTSLGQTPPPGVDVSATTTTVPSGIPAVDGGAEDFETVAEELATAIVEGYLPERESQRALESSGVERDLTVHRYRQFAETVGIDPEDDPMAEKLLPASANASWANEHLAAALVDDDGYGLTETLSEAFAEPEEAIDTLSTEEVTIVVRTWDT